jgi:hypothetical protein
MKIYDARSSIVQATIVLYMRRCASGHFNSSAPITLHRIRAHNGCCVTRHMNSNSVPDYLITLYSGARSTIHVKARIGIILHFVISRRTRTVSREANSAMSVSGDDVAVKLDVSRLLN